ncbi:hypothetical protein KBC31_03780 [Candidatus Saccharibacteria bacterium]|nr:hypothetical protein [Candidatus Saccharibacteria bacterium]
MDKLKNAKSKISKKTIIQALDSSKIIVISLLILGLFSYPLILVLGVSKSENVDYSASQKMIKFDKEEIAEIESKIIYEPSFSDKADHSPNPFSEQ